MWPGQSSRRQFSSEGMKKFWLVQKGYKLQLDTKLKVQLCIGLILSFHQIVDGQH